MCGECRTNPWPAVLNWPLCRNSDSGLPLLNTGKNADAGLTFLPTFRYLLTEPGGSLGFPIACNLSMKYLHGTLACLKSKQAKYQLSYANWSMIHLTKLCCALLIYAVPYWGTLHHAELTTLWATMHPADLHCTLLSYDAPYWATLNPNWATPHTLELNSILLSFVAHYWAILHPLSYAWS
jgi:hypothetical protein